MLGCAKRWAQQWSCDMDEGPRMLWLFLLAAFFAGWACACVTMGAVR